jgi:aspartate/tyrosine/aromatic aminotransferase
MVNKYHVYMTQNGRISVAGLNHSNVEYVANAFKQVTSD